MHGLIVDRFLKRFFRNILRRPESNEALLGSEDDKTTSTEPESLGARQEEGSLKKPAQSAKWSERR